MAGAVGSGVGRGERNGFPGSLGHGCSSLLDDDAERVGSAGISRRRGPGRRARAPGKNWISTNRGSRGGTLLLILIVAGQKQANQWRTRKPQDFRRVCFQLMGEATTAFQNLIGYFGAAEGKVPLLMVCVKPKPQHLVFQMGKGESRIIIRGFWLWRMAGTRTDGGFERCRGAQEGRAARRAPAGSGE